MTSYETSKIAELSRLEVNWDTDGALKITQSALAIAASILAIAPQEASDVSPLPNGGIDLEWEINGNNLLIEIHPSGTVTWAAIIAGKSEHGRYVSRIEELTDSLRNN